MAIVMISSLFQSGRKELAEIMAKKTNWPLLSREELVEKAREQGIKIGRLEVAMIKTPHQSEKLAREKDLYLAFLTATLCEKAREGNFIYYGRGGHLLLPGVSHRLRVGLSTPQEVRIDRTAQSLGLSPDKAIGYLKELDDDFDRWLRFMHGVDSRDPKNFDAMFNLENIGLSNAADILCRMAEMPEFQPTATSKRTLENLHMTAQAKLRLATDERTAAADLQVTANNGVVTVTYPPQQEQFRGNIPAVLADLTDCREIQCTMAETNILWIQERFDPTAENYQQITQLAQRWGAAIELMRLIPPGEMTAEEAASATGMDRAFSRKLAPCCDGGVEDDDSETIYNDGGLNRTKEDLLSQGRFGGQHTVCGGYASILERIQGSGHYALVVIGDMFLSKGHSARTRQTRELALNIRDRVKAPVVTAEEMKERLLFSKKQGTQLLGFMAVVVFLFFAVFTHQTELFNFLSGPMHQSYKWLSPVVLFLFIPLLAYLWGTVTGLALKIINID
jgi:cytidylate kinase